MKETMRRGDLNKVKKCFVIWYPQCCFLHTLWTEKFQSPWKVSRFKLLESHFPNRYTMIHILERSTFKRKVGYTMKWKDYYQSIGHSVLESKRMKVCGLERLQLVYVEAFIMRGLFLGSEYSKKARYALAPNLLVSRITEHMRPHIFL